MHRSIASKAKSRGILARNVAAEKVDHLPMTHGGIRSRFRAEKSQAHKPLTAIQPGMLEASPQVYDFGP